MPINPVQCDECPSYFADAAALNTHKRVTRGHTPTVKISLDTLMPTTYDEEIKTLSRDLEKVTWDIDMHYRTIVRAEREISNLKHRQEVISSKLFQLKRGTT